MKVKTLSPVHVGSGDKYLALEFELLKDRVAFLNVESVFEDLSKRGEDVLRVAKEVARGNKLSNYVDTSNYRERVVPLTGGIGRGREILKHIQTSGKLYIPGSSIKGAIRTVLLWKAVKDDRSLLDLAIKTAWQEISKNRGRVNVKLLRKLDDELENKVFRSNKIVEKSGDPKNDLLRGIRVTDTTPFGRVRIYEVRVLGTNLSLLVECIDCGGEAEVEITLDDFVLSYMQRLDLDEIAEASREFAEELIKVEKERLNDFRSKYNSRALASEGLVELKTIENSIKKSSIILRLGWGTGWYSTTIGTLLKTHEDFEKLRRKLELGKKQKPRSNNVSRNFPATMRVTSDGKLLGWVRIAI